MGAVESQFPRLEIKGIVHALQRILYGCSYRLVMAVDDRLPVLAEGKASSRVRNWY